jgi:hypothetical protein
MDECPDSNNSGYSLDPQDVGISELGIGDSRADPALPMAGGAGHTRERLSGRDHQERGRILYQARGVIVPITEYEAQQVVRNPFM